MTKLSYYEVKDGDDKNHLLYGTSKKEIVNIAGQLQTIKVPIKEIEQKTLKEIKAKYSEKQLLEVRNLSKTKWDRKKTTTKAKQKPAKK